jgi:hypothetical protein
MQVISPCDCWVLHIILNIPMYKEVEGTVCVEWGDLSTIQEVIFSDTHKHQFAPRGIAI